MPGSSRRVVSTACLALVAGGLGCGPPPIDYGGIDPRAAGGATRCRTGATLDAERGCVGDLAASGELLAVGYEDDAKPSFILQSASLLIDEHLVFLSDGVDTGAQRIGLFAGRIATGKHVATVRLVFRGHGEGPFSYLSGYRFEVRSTHELTLVAGQPLRLVATGFDRKERTMPLERRLAVRFDEAPFTLAPASGPTR